MRLSWSNTYGPSGGSGGFKTLSYTCGFCDNRVAAGAGYHATKVGVPSGADYGGQISICPHCNEPTYLSADGRQVPGPAFGGTVAHISSEDVSALYDEARNCMKVNAFTAAVMCCRKLLMHIAVSEGAEENKSFAYYVRYLAEEGHIPRTATAWVNHIRDKGNDANHEIDLMGREDAEQLIKFSEMLMRIMYEYPAEVADRHTLP
jgi:hypothetical protein